MSARGVTLGGLLLASACQPESLPPPPISETPSSISGVGGSPTGPGTTAAGTSLTGGAMPTSGTTGAIATSDSTATGTSSSGTGSVDALLTGTILPGTAGIVPTGCYITLYRDDVVDQDTGIPLNPIYTELVTIRVLPQDYAIPSVPTEDVSAGDSVYVGASCDTDGMGPPDDVWAWYPQLPVEAVTLPVDGIDLSLELSE